MATRGKKQFFPISALLAEFKRNHEHPELVYPINWAASGKFGPSGCFRYHTDMIIENVRYNTTFTQLRFRNEKQVFRVDPKLQKDVDQVNARTSGKPIIARKYDDLMLTFQKYPDGMVIDTNGDYTDTPKNVSSLYQTVAYINRALKTQVDAAVAAKELVTPAQMRGNIKNKKNKKPQAVVASLDIKSSINDRISYTSQNNPGAPLPNPYCKLKLKPDESGNYNHISDMSAKKMPDGQYPELTVDGDCITVDNVHKVMTFGTEHSALVRFNTISHNMGISCTGLITCDGIRRAPQFKQLTVADVFSSEDGDEDDEEEETAPPPR